MKKLAILTQSYNRAYTLPKLFDSLMCQTCFDFKWYIVDDGSVLKNGVLSLLIVMIFMVQKGR